MVEEIIQEPYRANVDVDQFVRQPIVCVGGVRRMNPRVANRCGDGKRLTARVVGVGKRRSLRGACKRQCLRVPIESKRSCGAGAGPCESPCGLRGCNGSAVRSARCGRSVRFG